MGNLSHPSDTTLAPVSPQNRTHSVLQREAERPAQIKSIQLGRGLAAAAVAVYHTYLILSQKTGQIVFESVAQFGYLGVPFFFVLSGFIIFLAHSQDMDRPESLGRYAFNRFVRVYPVYWLLSLVFVGSALAGFGDADFSWKLEHLLEDVTLFHFTADFRSPPLKVAWTLFFEIRFYVLFGLAIWSRKIALFVLLVWAAAALTIDPPNKFFMELFSPWNLAFLFGIVGAYSFRRASPALWAPVMVAGLVALVVTYTKAIPGELNSTEIVTTSLGFALIVTALAMAENQYKFAIGRFWLLLGDASYALYLVHSATISVLVIIARKVWSSSDLPATLVFFPILFSAILSGIIAHLIVEKPVIKYLKSMHSRWRRAT